MRLGNKIALVTGAASGIGKAAVSYALLCSHADLTPLILSSNGCAESCPACQFHATRNGLR